MRLVVNFFLWHSWAMGRLSLALGVFLLGGASLFAGPKHGSVEHGHATFQSIANGIEIHSGKQTIINWESFSIDAGEIARFCQSSNASAVLNRVIGSEQSLINGLLTSNGHVFLLNQNGILIGKDGVIDTAGFVASTLDLSNDQFLKGGDFLFKGDGKGSVINLGTIHTRGGDVFLIGYHVSNEGTIQTDGGVAGLASGAEVFLAVEGEERFFIRKGIDSEEIGASNDGVIRAAEVEIKASGNPFALAIKHGGEIEATGVAHRNGRVLLVADSGKTEVAGLVQAESGTVHVLGDEVTLTEAAAIDVSGAVGGEVLVGGDYKGSNPDIPNSRRTYIYKGAEVRADGHHGDGGKVIFWGDEATHYYGDTSAAALGEVGDGGFVEVSAKSNDYIFKGPVNASSINGAKGVLLLDPTRIRVRGNASNPAFPTTPPGTYQPTGVNTAELFINDIVGVLNGNNDVIIDSTGAGNGNGDIDFEASFSWNGTGNLSATAFRNITLTSGTTITSNTGNISFLAQGNGNGNQEGINLDGALISTSGAISLEGTSTLTGNLARHGVQISGTGSISTGGNISITGTTRSNNSPDNSNGVFIQGSVAASGTGTLGINGTVNANLNDTSHGIEITGTVSVVDGLMTMTGVTNADGAGNNGIDVTTGSVTVSGTGGITFDGTGSTSGSTNSTGVNLDGATVGSNSGLIDITGVGGTGVGLNEGIFIGNNASVTSTTGGITMDGTGGGTDSNNHGITIENSGLIRSITSGDINLTGTTTSGASQNTDGILMRQNSEVRSEGSGNIMMTGIGQAPGIGVGELSGIDIIDGDVIATGTGTIDLIGHCNANSEFSEGVKFQGATSISSTSGKITITGSNTSNLQESHGVAFESSTTAIQTTGGDIEISGTSSMGDTTSYGFFMPNGSTISTTGSGSIEITGDIASGTGTTGQNGVEISGASTSVTTVNGDISVTGRSGGTSGSSYGVLLTSSSTVQSTGSGNVTLDGESRATGGTANVGVLVNGNSTLSSGSGVVSMIGIGGMGASNNHGVELPLPANATVTSPGGLTLTGTSQDGTDSIGVLIPTGATALTSGAGAISITGNATGTGTGSDGVLIEGNVTASGSGAVSINGTSNGDASHGIFTDGNVSAGIGGITFVGMSTGTGISDAIIVEGIVSTTSTGPIGMTGTVSGSAGTSDGIDIRLGGRVNSVDGAIDLMGTSNGVGGECTGIEIQQNGGVQSTGSGSVTLTGIGSTTGTDEARGVKVTANAIAPSFISVNNGNLIINGTGNGTATENEGFLLGIPGDLGSFVTSTGAGNITINGTGSSTGTTENAGIRITGGLSVTSSGSGNITFVGQGGVGNDGYGVFIENGSDVTASGTGAISLTGTAGTGTTNTYGVYITDPASTVSSASGNASLDGTGGTGAGGLHNVGVFIENGGTLSSSTGVVSITGDGGGGGVTSLNHGIQLNTTSSVTSPGGLILDGKSFHGTNSRGVFLESTFDATASAGNISITGASSAGAGSPAVEIGGMVTTTPGTGTVTIQGTSSGSAATSPGVLITSGTVSSTTGTISITGTGNTGAALSEGILLDEATITASGGNIQLTGTGQDTSGSPVGIAVTNTLTKSSLATTGLGTMTLTTTMGDFTDSGALTNTYDTEQGAFSLTSAGAVLFSAGATSTITTILGPASLTANGGNIILDDSGSVTTGGGTASLTANSGAIQLGVVDVTNTGDVFITASGTVTDNSAALVNLIGNRGYISSGGTGPLPTLLNQFQGVTPTTGSIDLTNGQALELIAWNIPIPAGAVETANNGSIAIVTSSGGITVTNDVIADGTGVVGLDASAGPGAISVVEGVSSGSGAITIIGGSVTHSVNGNLATGGGVIDVTATSGNITMNLGTSYSTGGGNALLVASNSALLNLINAGVGDINVTATAGTITNNSGLNSPAILVGNQGTLTSALGAGTGTSSDNTAIGTNLTQLNGLVTGVSGGIIIFEQGGLNLGSISATNGTVDISALNAITQVVGNILALDALFTTRAGNIGTVNVVNTSSILLEASLAAGDLSIDVGGNTLTLNGNTDVGGNYTVLAGTYDKGTFNVRVGGTTTTPVPINPLTTVTASGLLDDFDISSVTLASSGNITVNLRGETYNVGNLQGANAIIINSAGNTITNSLKVTTVDPNLSPQQKDYNLVNTNPVLLNPMQHFIVNAAKGQNFTPGVANPKSSPFDNSPLNGFNGSTINILNVVPSDNVFPGWVSIRDSYTTVFEAGPNLSTEYVNTYGDLTIRTTTGAIMTGATGETMRTGGAKLTIESHGNLNIAGTVSNLTIPPVPLALNGIISYTSAIGSITGPALTQAAQVKLDAATGIGTGGQDLLLNTPEVVFTAGNDVLIELGGVATVAGDSTSGAIDIETSGAGNLMISSLTIDGLSRVGLTSSGVSGTQVVTTGGDILVNQGITGNGGPIQLTASGAVTHGASGNLTTTGVNAINVTATSGAITMDPITVYTTGNGFASLNAHTNINVAEINVGTENIFLNSTTGGILRVVGPPTNLIGGRGYALASSGIGASGNSLQTNLSEFQGRVALAGDIYLLDTTGGLQLTDWNINPGTGVSAQTTNGDIDIQTAAGDLTVVRPVTAGGAGTINLDANTGAAVLNQTVTSNTGSITITGATNVTHSGSGTVTVSSGSSGTVTETATAGDITMDPASMIVTQGGAGILSAILSAGTNVVISNVNVAAGDVSVTATGGAITRAGAGPNLIGGRGYCTSATGVGVSATPIRSTLTEFQAITTGIGPIALQETNAINLTDWSFPGNSVQTANGLIQIETQAGNLTITEPVDAGAGPANLNLTATTGSIVNNSGGTTPAILVGSQATLTAQTGIGSGFSTDPTAIGTNLDTLIAIVTGTGDVVIFEQFALDLGALTLNNGTVDINANDLIQQVGNPVLVATDARFTTRAANIGTADVVNGGNLTLNASVVAGNLDIDVGFNTLTLGGNSEVGINYTVNPTATYDPGVYQVNVGGTESTPPPVGGVSTVTASGAGPDFDLSSVVLAPAGDIVVNLQGGNWSANQPRPNNAILINSTNNSIANTLRLNTFDPDLQFNGLDYNLINSGPIVLQPAQKLIINAARGPNFLPLGSPNDSPFTASPLFNAGNGSNVTLINVGPNNRIDWVSIRDPFDATFEVGLDTQIQYVNAYGDLEITAAAGMVTTGADSQTVRAGGTNLRINASGDITVSGAVSNLTPPLAPGPPPPPTLNGNLSYTSTGGSVLGTALSQATNIKVSAVGGGIGTGAQDLRLTAGTDVVFESQTSTFIDLSGAATIAGSSSAGGIDIGTSGAGNLTIDTVSVDGLNKVGLMSVGPTGIQVATPSGGDILVNQLVSATSAPIQLTANGAVTHVASGDLTTTGLGTITVNANAGNLTMVDGTVYTTAGGVATLLASNNVQLSRVTTSGGNIFVTATAGNISKVGALVNLVGGNGFCSAATGIGALGTPILTTLNQFQGIVTGVGDLYLVDTTGVQLTNWNGGTNSAQTINGLIDIQTQGGDLTVLAPVVAGVAGTINLDANAASVVMGAAVSTNTGSITITGNTNVTHQAGGNVSVTSGAGGTVTETATTGDVTMDGNSSITTQGGNVNVTATAGSIAVAAINAAAGDIFLTATNGAISRVAGPAVNLTGGKGYGIAATGIGASGNVLQSTLGEFQGEVTGTGDLFLFDTAGGLQLTNWNGGTNSVETNDGAIDIQTGAGILTVVNPVVAGGAGTINLNANSANVLLGQSVSSNAGNITITGNTNVTHQATGNVAVTVGGGSVTETATNGNLTMDGASSISTQGGNVTLNAGSNIAVSEVDASTGNILMAASAGNISRVAGPLVNLIGANGFASAQTGIGASGVGNILQSTLTQFQGTVGGTGGIFLNDTDALQLTNWNGGTNSAQTNSGAIDIQTTSGSLTVAQPVVAGGSGTIKLDAMADAVVVNQTVTSNTGSITVTGSTGITHGMNGTVTVSSGAGGTVSETATTGDISMHGASKIITQGGNIALAAQNDLNVAEINTGATGQISAVATNGMITDTTTSLFLPNFVSDEVILQANTGIGSGIPSPSSTTDISTVANFLTASTVMNDIVISELNGLTLRSIMTQNGGNFFLEAGGLVNQDGVNTNTLQIDGNLTVVTSRASTLGTVSIVNSVNTNLAESEIAGNYTVNVTGDLDLSGNQFVGLDCNFNHTGTYTEAPSKVFHGGSYNVNGVDPDLQGPVINATGPTPNFNLDLAMPLSADPTITINLQGEIDTFSNPQLADAIILTKPGNTINGTIDIQTVDPMYQGTTPTNYHLIQTATPFTLIAGQTLIINAVRGTANPNVSGVLGSPFSGLVNGSNLGSNITLNLANTSNGVISIRDPNLCSLNVNGDPIFSHVNTYNDLTITAPSGSIATGAFTQAVRSSGSLLKFTADQDVTLNQAVNALTTAGVPFGEIVYTANNGSITGAGPSQAVGVSFIAPLGAVTTVTQTTNCIFNAMTGVDILNANTAGNFGGTVSGSLTITQVGTGDLRVNSVTVDGVTRTGITALDQTVNLTNNAGAITQIAGNVNAGTTGTVNLNSVTGITGIGPAATFQTLSRDVLAINSSSGEVRVENRLNGSNALSSSVRLNNGPGNAAAGRNLYFRQVGGSSVDFQTVNANGTGTLLAISGSANMNFSGNVNMGDSVIAVANHNMEVGGVMFNLNTPNAVATLILDQESPTLPGSGTFVNAGIFNISSGDLAIYAASGPQAPATAIFDPPDQVVLGSLAPLAIWDIGEPNGLDTKYATSYSDGGPYHGPGFGTNYTPGNGVFGSQVIWYKFDVENAPPSPSGAASGRIPFDPRIGINAWEVEYFLQYWDVNLNRLGDQNVPVMLVEENFETEPSSYRPHRSSIDKLREKVSTQ